MIMDFSRILDSLNSLFQPGSPAVVNTLIGVFFGFLLSNFSRSLEERRKANLLKTALRMESLENIKRLQEYWATVTELDSEVTQEIAVASETRLKLFEWHAFRLMTVGFPELEINFWLKDRALLASSLSRNKFLGTLDFYRSLQELKHAHVNLRSNLDSIDCVVVFSRSIGELYFAPVDKSKWLEFIALLEKVMGFEHFLQKL